MGKQKKGQPQKSKKNKNRKTNGLPVIVAIGASAGGLSALENFFKNTPPEQGITYVVIQHLDPSHESMLSDILQRYTKIDVEQVENKMEILPDSIYVIPPGNDLLIKNNHFVLEKQKNPRGVRLPIDLFFRSLKNSRHENAIGIILSGTGSDGTLGLRDIKAENGMIMAQSPETADHKGMPQSAIETGLVDYVLSPDKMPEKLIEYIQESKKKHSAEKNYEQSEIEKYNKKIFEILRNQTKHDFGEYKDSTVTRRIERRMAVNTVQSFEEYIELLKNQPDEADLLFKEFLIGVTSFFRDKDAFNSLEKNTLPLIINQNRKEPVRIWVTGCSTGEEAYSLAMIFKKHLKKKNSNIDLQIFASDIDDKSLEIARLGKYPRNIEADVPDEYLDSFFRKEASFYQVTKEIRESVVFANQSIVKDPPYSRLDLVSCRNLLIYLKSDTQNKIIDIFHYALKNDGFLFLGNSESLGGKKDMFEPIDSKWKIFRKKNIPGANKILWAYSGKNYSYQGADSQQKKESPRLSLKEFAESQALKNYMYPFLIINKEGDIQYSIGTLKNYFEFPQGEPNHSILSAAIDPLKVPIANALRKIKIDKEKLFYDNIRLSVDENVELVKISFIPIKKPASLNNLFIVHLQPSKTIKYSSKDHDEKYADIQDQDEYIRSIEQDLNETRDYLQSVIEELETSNEELKSANEEAQSSNEELQSTNEELETSKEELQSLNEELETSNQELQRKVSEVSEVNNDINNFISSTQIGVIFLDKEMRIQRFTPSMKNIIELLDTDIGRPISNFVTNLNYDNLVDDAEEVLDTLVPKKNEVSLKNGNEYWMRILPYRTMDDKINGIVITFTDISELKKAQNEIIQGKERFKLLFENMNSGISVVEVEHNSKNNSTDGKIIDVNNAYTRQTGIDKEKVVGKKISEVFPNYSKELFEKLVSVAETKEPYESVEYIPQFDKYLKLAAYSFQANQYITMFDDITDQVKAQDALIESEEKFKGLFNSMNSGIVINNTLWKENAKTPDIIVERINPAFEKITGIDHKNINNKNLLRVLEQFQIQTEPQLRSALQQGAYFESEIFWQSNEKHLRLLTFPIQEKQNVLVIQDITREKNELLARNHLASIVESSEDAIYSISTDGTIISWNKGAEKFFEYKQNEIVGKNVAVLSAGNESRNMHDDLIKKVLKNETVKNIELVQKTKSGKKIPVSLTKSPIRNENNQVVAISDVVKDMTRIKERENKLIEAQQKSERAALLKTTFLQNISHEIRTPMNSIIGFTDILKKRIKNGEDRKFMEAIDDSGHQLLRLIDDILDLSRLDAGELSISKTNFNLPLLLVHMKEQFEGVKKNKNKEHLTLHLDLPKDDEERHLYTDVNRLHQIFSNLLSNAIKYTQKGEISFGYEAREKDILFYVKDTGKGIKKEHLDKIFERFERAGIDSEDVFSGTGLGLSISKGLTQKLDGEIWCKSEVGKGSTFYFTLPNVSQSKPENAGITNPDIENEGVPNLEGKLILIAEDDEFSYQMLQALFIPTKAQVMIATDGEQAIELFKNTTPDLALLDIRLPKKTGYEILKTIKKKNENIPVIAQTAYATSDDKQKIITKGFDDFLIKPLTGSPLYNAMRKYLLNHEGKIKK